MSSSPMNIAKHLEDRHIRFRARRIFELRAHLAVAPSKNDVGPSQGLRTCDAGGGE